VGVYGCELIENVNVNVNVNVNWEGMMMMMKCGRIWASVGELGVSSCLFCMVMGVTKENG
jgi:hypothetical protein